jgi:hypothetical protein
MASELMKWNLVIFIVENLIDAHGGSFTKYSAMDAIFYDAGFMIDDRRGSTYECLNQVTPIIKVIWRIGIARTDSLLRKWKGQHKTTSFSISSDKLGRDLSTKLTSDSLGKRRCRELQERQTCASCT